VGIQRPAPRAELAVSVGLDSRLAADARAGLWQQPPTLPARWFYDERGSKLFDEITRLPEYYPTRRETEILARRSEVIAELTNATALLELGSGMSTKTRLLLDALTARRRPLLFVPLDVSEEVMTDAARAIAADYPSVTVRPVTADFTESLGDLPGEAGRRLIAFLGGTIGNFDEEERDEFLHRVRNALAAGDHFLLGADLVKSPSRLTAAYDDAAGVTAAFNRNLIEVLRTELGGRGLYADDFEHVARWNPLRSRVEMWLRARRDVHAHFDALERDWQLRAGEEMLTEVSTKFRLRDLCLELHEHQLEPVQAWTDGAGDFSLTLAAAVGK
jgi:L-histidine Nalpha-methyltransferase